MATPRGEGTQPDPAAVRAALGQAVVPALMPALAQATGDLSLLRDEFRPDPANLLDPQGGVAPDDLATAREMAFDALTRLAETRSAGTGSAQPSLGRAELVRLVEFTVGGPVDERYLPLFEQELAATGADLRAPDWTREELAPGRPFRVVVVGAGMSGLAAAHRLGQAGIDYVVVEKNDDVGGTWLENRYPGCRVDVANHFYSYSFRQDEVWPQHFSTQDVLLGYFRRTADDLGIREHIRFGTEVVSMEFDETELAWAVEVRTRSGATEVLAANAVVSAVGQLNRPNFPDIPGQERFRGPSFHSARWDTTASLEGRRVAVIGTGASAAQLVPLVADRAAELILFQRTPPWLVPTPDYHDRVTPEVQWLLGNVPFYEHWYRFWLFWRNAEGMLPAVRVDPGWQGSGLSVSAANDLFRMMLTAYLQQEFADRPDLLADVIPDYPVGAKRVIRDNGIWARTLKRPDVQVVTEKISEITEAGIATTDGVTHEVDVIVYATGFTASQFLMPMSVRGRAGLDLHEMWAGDARAYLGITVPGFPNLFLLYGPNTNIVVNGSIIFLTECEVQYVMSCLRLLLENNAAALSVRADVHDAYNQRVDAENVRMAWGASSVNAWYKNALGRVSQNWPGTLLEYWDLTRSVNADDYELLERDHAGVGLH